MKLRAFGILGFVISVVASQGALAQKPVTSTAQSCTVKNVMPTFTSDKLLWGFKAEVGTVVDAGDLKFNLANVSSDGNGNTMFSIDVKAPGIRRETVKFDREKQVSLNICNQEVVVSTRYYDGYGRYFIVSVF